MLIALIVSIVGNFIVMIGTGWYIERVNKSRREELEFMICAVKSDNIQEFQQFVKPSIAPAVHNFVKDAVKSAYTIPDGD